MIRRLSAISIPGCVAIAVVAAAETRPSAGELVSAAGFSDREIQRIGDEILVRELDVSDSTRSAAFAGIVRIRSDGSLLAGAMDGTGPARHPDAAGDFGRFQDPAQPRDVAGLGFPDDDFEVLEDCEVQRCKFKLSRSEIEELSTIDWNRDDAGKVFTERFRRHALAYVQRYRGEGNRGLIRYADKPTPVALGSTIDSILKQLPEFQRHAPTLSSYLLTYPAGGSPTISESIVWSVQDFGYRPTLAIDHILVDRAPEPSGATHLIVSKTIYANHYLAGRLRIGTILDGEDALGAPGHFVLLVDRIEFDDTLGVLKRSLLTRGLLADVEARLGRLRALADSQAEASDLIPASGAGDQRTPGH